ncbi:MAG: M1 family aminopeptidase, partial [Bacteroidota bacterium]
NYEVRITVPGNTMVWATGTLENADAVLQAEFAQRYHKSLTATEVVKVFAPEDYTAKKSFFQKAKTHTFLYKAQGVPDFAFALSDHYLWDASSTLVDPGTGRRAGVSAAYNPNSQDYYTVCEVTAKALNTMSTYLPGYPYPYPRMTVFNGDDGMEFPMMCNDASTQPNSPIGLTVHESSHTYFPFMMGINEQYYAWMDEGWAAFFDVLVTDTIVGKPTGRLRNYPDYAGTDADMPPMVPARHLTSPAYRVASYNRPQAAYMALYQMLGYPKFHQCMTEYMNRWKGKHPQPFDFFNTWNDVSGENLDWFWKPWFFDWGYPDLAVTGVEENGANPKVVVENKGTMPMSAMGEVEYSDGTKESFMRSASFWKDGAKKIKIPVAVGKTVKKVTLGNRLVSDTKAENNVWK